MTIRGASSASEPVDPASLSLSPWYHIPTSTGPCSCSWLVGDFLLRAWDPFHELAFAIIHLYSMHACTKQRSREKVHHCKINLFLCAVL